MELTAEILADARTAGMLLELGVTTYEKIRGYFADQGHDAETLAAILQEVDRRIARRMAAHDPDPTGPIDTSRLL